MTNLFTDEQQKAVDKHNAFLTEQQQAARFAKYLTDKQVASRYDISRPSVWRWVREGHLPGPERIGPNTQRWRIATLDSWDSQRADQPGDKS